MLTGGERKKPQNAKAIIIVDFEDSVALGVTSPPLYIGSTFGEIFFLLFCFRVRGEAEI
jgi:hypothetical protein